MDKLGDSCSYSRLFYSRDGLGVTSGNIRYSGRFRVSWDDLPEHLNEPREWNGSGWYLSRVQYGSNWHFAIERYPFVHWHYDNWQGYIGFKRDADKVTWIALYLGKIWK